MLILAVAMLLDAQAADVPSDPKAAFKECIKHVDMLDLTSDGLTKCLHEYSAAMAKDNLQNVDPLAKKVAEDEAEKYSIVLTTYPIDRVALCVQAALTAQAYLNAKMPRKYDSWKAVERSDCAAADRAGRVRN